jgi:membrane associated rhomboid family serine protease
MQRRLVVVPVIISICVAVFLAWRLTFRDPVRQEWMVLNFLTSAELLGLGRFWTPLTAAFSHMELWHLLINMIVLWSFGQVMERLLGRWRFASFYLIAGIVSSLCHCLVSAVILHTPETPALGASGAICGVLLVFALMFPRHRILLFGVIPIPALLAALAFMGLDVWGLFAQSRGGGLPIGHGAHLGGAFCGIVFYLAFVRPRLSALRSPPGPRGGAVQITVTPTEARELSRLREKVELGGPSCLTAGERDFLKRMQQRAFQDG